MEKRTTLVILICLLLTGASLNSSQFQTEEISLNIFPHTLSFHPGDPDLEPSTPAESPIQIEITVNANQGWTLNILANGNLRGDRGKSIAIENINWQANPSPPFLDGSLSKRSPQLLARGSGKTQVNGELFFYLKNSWEYQAGEYSQTLSLTLSSF